jgi:hypothetical protein
MSAAVFTQAGVEEQIDVLSAQPLDIHGAARHEMAQPLDRLRRTDELARAASARILLAGLLVELARGGRTADRAGVRELVGHGVGRTFLEDHPDDLRDDVAGALDDDGVADADIDRPSPRIGSARRVDALDIVLVVERDVFDHGDAADADRGEPGDRRERAGAADLDVDTLHGGRRLLGRELVATAQRGSPVTKPQRRCNSSRSSL